MKQCKIGKNGKGYCLSLGDGNKWWLTADQDLLYWLDKFASIMALEQGEPNGSPKFIFSKRLIGGGLKTNRYYLNDIPCSSQSKSLLYEDKILRIWCHEDISDVFFCEMDDNGNDMIKFINMWNVLLSIYQRSIYNGGLPFHAGLIELAGRGVLLAGPGNIGKSTCCRRLPDYWNLLCDDEALVVCNSDGYFAHPFPTWSDYLWKRAKRTWNVQYHVPLLAIFFLEQSKKDELIPLAKGKAAVLINESSAQICHKFWGRLDKIDKGKYREKIFNNACKIAKIVPAFILRVNHHGKFWVKIEKALGWCNR